MRIIALGDLHLPFGHKGAISWALARCKRVQPDVIVQMGDLYDMFSLSRFPRDVNYITLKEELEQAREQSIEIWETLHRYCPKAKLYQLMGNHDERPMKKVLGSNIPEISFLVERSLKDVFTFDHVTTQADAGDPLLIGRFAFHHGHLSGLGKHCEDNLIASCVGHSHVGGTYFRSLRDVENALCEVNAGYLADPMLTPLRYRPLRWRKWTLGLAEIDDEGPRFIPYRPKKG